MTFKFSLSFSVFGGGWVGLEDSILEDFERLGDGFFLLLPLTPVLPMLEEEELADVAASTACGASLVSVLATLPLAS